MTDRDIMQQALYALEAMQAYAEVERKGLRICDEAITALSERLAQPEQEPVPPPWWPAVENILNEYGLQAIDFVDDFKKALAQPEQDAVLAEREACAELCERMAKRTDDIRSAALEMAAENIRARGNT